jgi:DNA-binding IclR family transcriptional regulator
MAVAKSEFQGIQRVASVLSALASAPLAGLRLADIAQHWEMSRTAAARLLEGLSKNGVVERSPHDGRYYFGSGLAFLLRKAVERFDLRNALLPTMRAIAAETGDVVHLSLRVGPEALCIARLEGDFPIKSISLRVGDRRPLGVGTGSMALLAFLPDDAIARIRESDAAARRAFGFDDVVFSGVIEDARRCGYVYNSGFVVPGMYAVGVPIRKADGEPFAALSVSCIASRMPPERASEIAAQLRSHIAEFQAAHASDYDVLCVAILQRHYTSISASWPPASESA